VWQARWAKIRDVLSWGLGAYWGQLTMADAGPADPWKIALVAALLSVPFAARADEVRRRVMGAEQVSQNGAGPPRETTRSPSPPRGGS
jgi:hypothetical protein